MGMEIERKFLLRNQDWRPAVERSLVMRQGYLSADQQRAIRIRITGEQADINIKSTEDGIHRWEYEYAIPLADAQEMLDHIIQKGLIEKTRHIVHYRGHCWEIDEFFGDNAGLIVAEIELQHIDEPFERPPWLGEEISSDPRYFNSNLSQYPYCQWKDG